MADQVLFNKLAYVDRLTRAGISDEQARAHAEGIDEALRESVATKLDIAELKAAFAEFKSELRGWLLAQTFALLAVIGALHFLK
jgi:hypothetical protein